MSRFINIAGNKYGLLTVLSVAEERKRGVLSWSCLCECGNTKVIAGPELRRGDTKSCGCLSHKGTPKDISGNRKGSLVAVESTGVKSGNGDYIWKFLCDCGKYCERTIGNFNGKGNNQSCGECNRKEMIVRCEKRKTHGFPKNHKTYKAWCKIKERCYNPSSKDYATYGARGIGMEESFREDFLAFYEEVGEAPDDGQRWSIDRIDHTRGYERGNMRWATDFQQARNKGKMKNNSSGVTGVHWENKVHPNGKNSTTYAVAQWKEYDEEGVQVFCKKSFSTKKFGVMPAFCMAVKHRKEVIAELNRKGYGYANNHGD